MNGHNSTTMSGTHGGGIQRVNTGKQHRGRHAPSGNSPTTGAHRSFDGLHPERVKELKNEGERQAEEQVSEEPSPFNGSLAELEAPETADNEGQATMPEDEPPAGIEHEEEPHAASIPRRRLGAVTGGGPLPHGDAPTGGMHTRPQRGGSAFYGD